MQPNIPHCHITSQKERKSKIERVPMKSNFVLVSGQIKYPTEHPEAH